ncbi:MAG TPA: hypothetical protein VGD78_07140 [Chthoniobacterales bacterium]
MSAFAFALPGTGHLVEPVAVPRTAGFKVGDAVIWIPDRDVGTVLRVLLGEAFCIHWESNLSEDYWYSSWSGSLCNIELLAHYLEKEAA